MWHRRVISGRPRSEIQPWPGKQATGPTAGVEVLFGEEHLEINKVLTASRRWPNSPTPGSLPNGALAVLSGCALNGFSQCVRILRVWKIAGVVLCFSNGKSTVWKFLRNIQGISKLTCQSLQVDFRLKNNAKSSNQHTGCIFSMSTRLTVVEIEET